MSEPAPDPTPDDEGRPTGSRHEYESTDTPCPQGCTETDPMGRGMRRVTHYTGEYQRVDVPGGSEVVEVVERYSQCPVCGWRVDV